MRAVLKPQHRPIVRDARTLQLGAFPDAAVLPDDAGIRALLDGLDGRRALAEVAAELVTDGVMSERKAQHIIELLMRADALDDASAPLGAVRTMPDTERHRLHHDVRAWSMSRAGASSGLRILRLRRAAWIEVDGHGRLALGIAAALAGAGVGHVSMRDAGEHAVTHADVGPLGPHTEDVATRTLDAATAIVARFRARTPCGAADAEGSPELAIVVADPGSARADAWLRRDVPHLLVHSTRGHGLVGPLVVPGRTACGRCLEAHRTDADPARVVVAAHVADTVDDLDSTVCTSVAALAVAQAMAFLECGTAVPSTDGLLRVDAVHATTSRTPLAPHRRCGCTWAAPEAQSGPRMGT
jgi:bacteriocin biosynthesis cyclodehydratase domain-containing protein